MFEIPLDFKAVLAVSPSGDLMVCSDDGEIEHAWLLHTETHQKIDLQGKDLLKLNNSISQFNKVILHSDRYIF